MAILVSDKISDKLKLIRIDEEHFILIKGSINQENSHASNSAAPNVAQQPQEQALTGLPEDLGSIPNTHTVPPKGSLGSDVCSPSRAPGPRRDILADKISIHTIF